MGWFRKYLFDRGVTAVLKSEHSSRVFAHTKLGPLIQAPLILSTFETLGYLHVSPIMHVAAGMFMMIMINKAAYVRATDLPNHRALEWKHMHAEWLEGGAAPPFCDEKYFTMTDDNFESHLSNK